MLTVNCICVGKLKERYWTQACEEYQKRLGAFCKFRIIEVAEHKLPEQPSETQIQQALKAEGEKILQLAAGSTLIPLCIEGKQIDSPGLGTASWCIGFEWCQCSQFCHWKFPRFV